jgi:sulfate permease, SulP family
MASRGKDAPARIKRHVNCPDNVVQWSGFVLIRFRVLPMMPAAQMREAASPSFAELFTPKLVTVMRDPYGPEALRADLVAGMTVAIVAIPLSMAIAIASGVSPAQGLFTSIIGGLIVSMFGGSRFQIGGPAGAFIVLVSTTISQHGIDGLALAAMMSGVMLMAIGFLRLGTYIKYIPYPVTVGFTAGIGAIIFAGQIKELLGLTLPGREPGPVIPKLEALYQALPTFNPSAMAVALLAIGIILLCRHYRPSWPNFLIAVGVTSVVVAVLHLPVATIGSRFGAMPRALPLPHLPDVSLGTALAVLPDAFAFTLLGGIESLLSAVVADSMTGRRHRSNCELVAQGLANIVTPLFGGICVTGTIARTATNVRAGAHGPISGMAHALFLLILLMVAAPLAAYIPLAALAGVLTIVCWGMAERHGFVILLRTSRGDAVVLLTTFLLTIFRDLTTGIVGGFAVGALIFLRRMSSQIGVEQVMPLVREDTADNHGKREHYDAGLTAADDIIVYRISGAFFFGTAAAITAVLDRIAVRPRAYVIDYSEVALLDSTAAAEIERFAVQSERRGTALVFTGARTSVRHALLAHDLRPPRVRFRNTIADGVIAARDAISGQVIEEDQHPA